jgi:hypothetical protein
MLFNQNVHGRWQRARAGAPLEHADRASVLLAAKDQLGLFLALGHLVPDRHHHRQHDAHDAHRNQQRDHGVSRAAGATVRAFRPAIRLTV